MSVHFPSENKSSQSLKVFSPCVCVQLMIHPDPTRRPSTSELIRNPVLLTAARMSADQLRVELNAEKFKNALLQK